MDILLYVVITTCSIDFQNTDFAKGSRNAAARMHHAFFLRSYYNNYEYHKNVDSVGILELQINNRLPQFVKQKRFYSAQTLPAKVVVHDQSAVRALLMLMT